MKFVIRANEPQELRSMRTIEGAIEPISVDFSPWADDSGAITSATWSVVGGNASISGQSLASNVATAIVTTADVGDSTIEVKGINATYTKPIRIRILAKDPGANPVYDYGRRWA